jgi:hypothetical protein
MYSLSIPVSALRTKMRQEFERHRYVNQIGVVDTLLFQSHAEYQVRSNILGDGSWRSTLKNTVLKRVFFTETKLRVEFGSKQSVLSFGIWTSANK